MNRILCFVCLMFFGSNLSSSEYMVPERLFKMTGTEANISQGDLLYKSQAAGYYTGGGGMVVRSPVKSTQFLNASLPKIQAGCGGIDIYTGGFSFINGKQIVETMQAVSSNAAGFAFMLGLETVSPSISNTVRQLQSWANTINGIGINSCETAAQLVGSVWPKNDIASEHICRTMGTSSKQFTDYTDARHGCSSQTMSEDKKDKRKEYFPLDGEYNIAWEALMTQPYFKDPANREMAETYMTLVGTFVVIDGKAQFFYSKAEDSEFLRALMEGGSIQKYQCKDERCLIIELVNKQIAGQDSWFAKIRNSLANMQDKIKNDEPLNANERGLLATSRLPLFKIVNVLSAYHRGGPCPVDMDNIADIVTWDVLAQIINEAIETVRRGCVHLRENSMYAGQTDIFLEDIERVRNVVQRYQDHAQKSIDLEMRILQKMQMLEKQVNSEIMVY